MSSAAPNRAPLSREQFAAATNVSRETLARLEAYAGLLAQWSPHINLVAAATLGDLWRRHFLDSAQLLPMIPPGAQSLVDLGSGAGFPGLVLAVLGVPGVELVEAYRRKASFLREATRVARAEVTLRPGRGEAVGPQTANIGTVPGVAPRWRLLGLGAPSIA